MVRQLLLFSLAGCFHTLLDFLVFNLLTRQPLKFSRIKANCVSTTVAMSVSFTANLLFVFRPEHVSGWERSIKFIAVTGFSSYLLQNVMIYFLSSIWLIPVRSAKWFSRRLSISGSFSDEFVERNTVKAIAVLTGFVWNFFWYRYFVFVG
jgi:putative flippase GtrA